MNRLFFAAAVLLTLSIFSCASVSGPQVRSAGTSIRSDAPSIEDEVLVLVNQYRKSIGLGALKTNNAVVEESRRHSYNMAHHIVPFSHEGFNTRSKTLASKIPGMRSVAENVAYGQASAREVVGDWLKSPGHKMNIEGNYTQTGIGIVADKKGVLYYTQMFVR
ncbi:MAG TPA: CAP domain-containing protein [Chitinophagaceae bacterium]